MIFLFLAGFAVSFSVPVILDNGLHLIMASTKKLVEAKELYTPYEMVSFCDTDQGTKSTEKVTGYLARKGKQMTFKTSDVETVVEGEYLITVSHNEKVILLTYAPEEPMNDLFMNNLIADSAVLSFQVIPASDGSKKVIVKPKANSKYDYLNQADYQIEKSGWLKSIKLNFNRNNQPESVNKCDWMEIRYTGTTTTIPAGKLKSVYSFVTISNNQARLKPAYKNYELNSSLNLKTP